MNTVTLCAERARLSAAYIRKLQREIAAYEVFAGKVRDTSTSALLRTHADILLSSAETLAAGALDVPCPGCTSAPGVLTRADHALQADVAAARQTLELK